MDASWKQDGNCMPSPVRRREGRFGSDRALLAPEMSLSPGSLLSPASGERGWREVPPE